MKKLFQYCSKHFKKKIIITGIGDPIFFNANNKILNNLKRSKSLEYASDGLVYQSNDFLTKKYELDEIVKGDSIFCATGITSGDLVSGIKIENNQFISETLVTHKSSDVKKIIKKIVNT